MNVNEKNKALADRYQHVVDTIRQFETKYHRPEGAVRLIAVSKTHPVDKLSPIHALGQVDFAENYLQEASAKIDSLANSSISWHFIGPIQSRKAGKVSGLFDWVHSVDRLKVAQILDKTRTRDEPINVLLQVNLQQEASKSGVSPDEALRLGDQIPELTRLKLRGLMAIPPPSDSFSEQRRVFARLRKLAESMSERGHQCDQLSMGMSGDLEAAIAEGATMVRIGTAIFGRRDQ